MTPLDWAVVSFLTVLGGILAGAFQHRFPAYGPTERRLAQLELKINLICEHLGIEQNQPMDQVQGEIVRGRKIIAIKLYREQTGVSLVVAKEAVDAMEAQMKAQRLV